MKAFLLIWFGQVVSLTGSSLTSFALGVWVYQLTGSATQFALISLFATLPGIFASPLAGVMADRWNRRWVMIISDSGAVCCTLMILLLLNADILNIWHIYIINSVRSVFNAFQFPAYTAAITQMIPKRHLGRASGMTEGGDAVSFLISPLMAGVLMGIIRLEGIIIIDFITFLFSMITLFIARIPDVHTTAAGEAGKGSLLYEALFAWNYIVTKPGLFAMLIYFAVINLLMGMVEVLATPLVLSFASPVVLGTILSVGGIGMVAGSLIMSAWGGPRRLIMGVIAFDFMTGFYTLTLGFHTYVPILAATLFLLMLGMPISNGCCKVIWQKKVESDLQGRVFALTRMVSWSSLPFAYILAGPLADYVFEPLMASDGFLAGSVGRIIGVGHGRGIGLLFIVMGLLTILTSVAAFLYPRLRLLEDELPDAG